MDMRFKVIIEKDKTGEVMACLLEKGKPKRFYPGLENAKAEINERLDKAFAEIKSGKETV